MTIGCDSLEDVRREIDRIDAAIVRLIAERGGYVRQAARFKRSESDVAAPERARAVVERARALAEREGADPDLVADLYRMMIDRFIATETVMVREREAG